MVFLLNGIPWWYPLGLAPRTPPLPDLDFLDPGGVLARTLSRSIDALGRVQQTTGRE